MPDPFTLPEMVRILKRLEPRLRTTPRQLRYLMASFEKVNQAVHPAHRPLGQGDSARFSLADGALLLLVLKVIDACGHRVAWAVFVYLGEALHQRFRSGKPSGVLVMTNARADLMSAAEARHASVDATRFPLDETFRRVADAAAAEARKRGTVARRVPQWKAPELLEEAARAH